MKTTAPKQFKVDSIKAIKEDISKSNIMIITDHNTLTVGQMTEIRDELFKGQASYKVVKNTLAARAFEGDYAEQAKKVLEGPTSIIFGYGEVVHPAKVISKFVKANEKPVIKGAIMEGRFLEATEIKKIASLPSKEVLLSMLVSGVQSPIRSFVNVCQGPLRKVVYALSEIQKKKGV